MLLAIPGMAAACYLPGQADESVDRATRAVRLVVETADSLMRAWDGATGPLLLDVSPLGGVLVSALQMDADQADRAVGLISAQYDTAHRDDVITCDTAAGCRMRDGGVSLAITSARWRSTSGGRVDSVLTVWVMAATQHRSMPGRGMNICPSNLQIALRESPEGWRLDRAGVAQTC